MKKATHGSNKGRNAAYLVTALVLAAAAAYFGFFRGNSGPGPSPEAQQRAAEIQASSTGTPEQPPELPVSQRAPRGAAVPK